MKNMDWLRVFATLSFFLGVLSFVAKSIGPEYIDKQGVLHEYFFLVPTGFLFIFLGLLLFMLWFYKKFGKKS
ncbi:DUF3955 domain-containing protein [Streptococcus gallinaceus]|uniref:Membrane protein n=1 Tax=Streptococcus gallinaceus TaxID=165758 RepID=A0ABV2JL75_9STRE